MGLGYVSKIRIREKVDGVGSSYLMDRLEDDMSDKCRYEGKA